MHWRRQSLSGGLEQRACRPAVATIAALRLTQAGVFICTRIAAPAMTPELASKRLYIVDLAQRQLAMECGRSAMHALTYRLLAKRLRQAVAGLPEPMLRQMGAATVVISAKALPMASGSIEPLLSDQLAPTTTAQSPRAWTRNALLCRRVPSLGGTRRVRWNGLAVIGSATARVCRSNGPEPVNSGAKARLLRPRA